MAQGRPPLSLRILITGITGFVGSHLAEYALGRGAEVWGWATAYKLPPNTPATQGIPVPPSTPATGAPPPGGTKS